jgi:hypothetical protein
MGGRDSSATASSKVYRYNISFPHTSDIPSIPPKVVMFTATDERKQEPHQIVIVQYPKELRTT